MMSENDQFKTCSCRSVIVIHQMAPLFSKVDLNKLRHDVQNEETLICATFGKDLFNISKVIHHKKWPSFFDSQCSNQWPYTYTVCMIFFTYRA